MTDTSAPGNLDIRLPEGYTTDSIILIDTERPPAVSSLPLNILAARGGEDCTAVVVTTEAGADEMLKTSHGFDSGTRPKIGIIDTVSANQYISALYRDPPLIYLPRADDRERLLIAHQELTRSLPRSNHHDVLVRSLSPLLQNAPLSHVRELLSDDLRGPGPSGNVFVGVELAAHDRETLRPVTRIVDGVLHVESTEDTHQMSFKASPSGLSKEDDSV